MNDKKTLIEISAEEKNIKQVASQILSSLASYNVGEERVFDIRLCIEEAVRNAILHGNRLNKDSRIRVSYAVDNGRIAIEVEDEGEGFDPDKVPDPTVKHNVKKLSGRGIFLIKRLMDRVEFNKKGNKIYMEKSLR